METYHPEHPHSVEVGHHEKKPVLKKVKDKVKKIKDTISKKRHGHDDHEHEHDVSEEDEGYEEDEEEREADPEVYVAPPMYESAAAGNLVRGRDENLGDPGNVMSLGEVMAVTTAEDLAVPKHEESQLLYPSAIAGERRNLIRDRDENIDPEKVSLRAIAGRFEEDPVAPPKSSTGTQQDHPSYPSPTDEVGETPLLSSFQAMAVSDNPKGVQDVLESPPTGTHGQFSPVKPQQEKPKEETQEQKSSSYTDKISSTATAAKDAAVSTGIGLTEYGKKIPSTVYDKVSGAGTTIMGKGTAEKDETKSGQPEKMVPEKGVSVTEYIMGKLRPGDEDRALCEVISDAIQSKKQEAAEPGASGSSEGSEGKGMVEKIKGAVTSWMGAGSIGGPRATPTTDIDSKGKGQSVDAR